MICPVAPFAGAWIEIGRCKSIKRGERVAPFAGAWIEMMKTAATNGRSPSLPSRERGLKLKQILAFLQKTPVAPFAGAWIEIGKNDHNCAGATVAPFAGAWIEILPAAELSNPGKSLPSRERGLK